MGTSLIGLLPQNTYSGLIKFGDNAALSASLKAISDGAGNDTMLSISTTALQIGGATGLNWDNTNKSLGIGTSAPVGILHLYKSAAATRLAIDGDAGQNRLISYRTGAVQRFGLYVNNTAESGSNAGSDFAIRAYSDAGTLLNTPLFIKRSTGNVGIGTTTPTSRLQVKSDGTNPVVVFESTSGGAGWRINALATIFEPLDDANHSIGSQFKNLLTIWTGIIRSQSRLSYTTANQTQTTGNIAINDFSTSIGAAAGSANFRPINIGYTINNSGAQTGTATGIFLNATETALNGMTHNLIDLQVGGVSKFLVNRLGIGIFSGGISQLPELTMNNSGIIAFSGRIRIKSPSTNAVMFQDNTETSAANLILGLQTSSFPMLKRNGTAIEFRLADDSNVCSITAGAINGSFIISANGMCSQNWYDKSINTIWLTVDNTTAKANFKTAWNQTGLPTTRPSTVGDIYIDTAANILANGDKILAIRQ